VVQPEPLHHTGSEALDQDVRRLEELPADLPAALVLEVEGDAPLAPVQSPEEGLEDARGVAPLRPLDEDHVGAQVGEQHRAVRARVLLRETDDADPGEEARHVRAFRLIHRSEARWDH
jgi:hypothetical protein